MQVSFLCHVLSFHWGIISRRSHLYSTASFSQSYLPYDIKQYLQIKHNLKSSSKSVSFQIVALRFHSCLLYPVSCLLSPASCIMPPVSCFLSHVLSHVSYFTSSISCLLPHVSCLHSSVSLSRYVKFEVTISFFIR